MLLIKLFVIGPVTGPQSAVLALGRDKPPRPVTGPLRNDLINENSLISIEKLELGQYRKQLGQYESDWPSFSVLADFLHIGRVCHRYDAEW